MGGEEASRFLRTALDGSIAAGVYEERTMGALRFTPSPCAITRITDVFEDVLYEYEELLAAARDIDAMRADPVDEALFARRVDEAIGEAHVAQVGEWVSGRSIRYGWRAQALAGSALLQLCTKPNAVKLGLVLLGSDFEGLYDPYVMIAGHHEDLTRFCVDAFRRSRTDPEAQILALGEATRGYGRLAAVRALQGTRSEVTKAWLRTTGWRTTPVLAEVAIIAAEQGALLHHLTVHEPGLTQLLDAAELLGDTGSDLTEFDDALPIAEVVLTALAARTLTPDQRWIPEYAAQTLDAKLRGQLDGEAPQRWSMPAMNRAWAAAQPFLGARGR